MMRKIIVVLLLLAILTACAPVVTPETETPAADEYPAPAQQPTNVSPYPGLEPDTPVQPVTPPAEARPLPFGPQEGDKNLKQGMAFIDSADVIVMESFPPQFMLGIQGNLPTPCNELRVMVSEPNDENRIDVRVYSLVDPDTICIQVLEPFSEQIPLGSFDTGTYSVFVNGEQVGEFTAP